MSHKSKRALLVIRPVAYNSSSENKVSSRSGLEKLEPTIGIEPMNLFLTKEALYRLSYVGVIAFFYSPTG